MLNNNIMLNNKTSEISEKSPRPRTVKFEQVRMEVAGLKAILNPATQTAKSVRRPLFRS